MSRGRLAVWVGIAATILAGLALVGAGLLMSDPPPPVAFDAAAGQAQTEPAEPAADAAAPAAVTTMDGRWTVDRSSGSFEDFSSSWAGYRVDEQIAGIGANTAVGRTPDVQGHLVIAGNTITEVNVSVNMASLRSDNGKRDTTLGDIGLQTNAHPTSTFTLSQPITVDPAPAEGTPVAAQAVGNLTLHAVTRVVTIPLEARFNGSQITVISSFPVALADFGIDKPVVGDVLSVADTGTVEMQLHFVRA